VPEMTMEWNESELDNLLHQRRFDAPDESLAARIIAAAAQRPQQLPLSPLEWLWRVCEEFHLPRPAFALACVLVIGLVAGLVMDVTNGNVVLPQQQAQMASNETVGNVVPAPAAKGNVPTTRLIETVFYPEEEML